MVNIVKFNSIENRIIEIRGQKAILDHDVAKLYDVETKRINEAVKNNKDKFPNGYIIELNDKVMRPLRSKISTANISTKSRVLPKAFTEKGLYMLATILKGERAVQTTIAIIEAFAKIRELSRTIGELSANPDQTTQKSLMQKSGEIMADLLGEEMHTDETETEIELNFAVLKLKHIVKRKENK